AVVIRCPSWTRWWSYSLRIERVARCAERSHLLQCEETRQGDAARPSLGCTSTTGGDPAHAILHAASACRVCCWRHHPRRPLVVSIMAKVSSVCTPENSPQAQGKNPARPATFLGDL